VKLGQYELVSLLGSGGMAEVWRARDPKLEREVAIKILSEATATDAEFRARFLREARVVASLNHPNIAQIFAVEEQGSTMFLVMELIDGVSLADVIASGPLGVDHAVDILLQATAAVGEAHDKGIVHRDLKPENIMISPRGVKVLDFGIAREIVPDRNSWNTGVGVILGTPSYMSPEQAQGRPVKAASDIFSLGAVFYEMLSGQRPFGGESLMEVLLQVVTRPHAPLTGVPPALAAIVDRCLQKQPAQRFQSAAELTSALAHMSHEPTVILPGSPLREGPRVLVADDDPLSRRVFRAALEQMGYRVDEAADGVEAVRQLKSNDYEALITDLLMPRLDGWEVLDFVRKSKSKRPNRVFVTTTIRDLKLSEVDRAIVEAVVAKPVAVDQLNHLLEITT